MTEAPVRGEIELQKMVEILRGDQTRQTFTPKNWVTRLWGRGKQSERELMLEIIRKLVEKLNLVTEKPVPTPHHLEPGRTYPPPPPPPPKGFQPGGTCLPPPKGNYLDLGLLTSASYMWERFLEERDLGERMALAPCCIQLHKLLSTEKRGFERDFFEDREDSTKKCLQVVRGFLAIGQFVRIQSTHADFVGVLLRPSYNVARDMLRLEAYGDEEEFDQTFDSYEYLKIKVIGTQKEPEQIFDPKNARFSNSTTIDANDNTKDNDDAKTVVDAFLNGREKGNNT